MRFGLIGCGWAGALRADAIAQLRGSQLVAVSDQAQNLAEELAGRHRATVEADWQALVERRDLDAVIVSTPPPLHAHMCTASLERGKDVLCEKPLARTPEECLQILAAATRSERVLATGFNLRFFPAVVKAKQILESGQIGELDHIRSYAGHPGGREFTHAWVHDANVMGGGTLLDNGIHMIDLTCYFLGDVVEVKGYATENVWKYAGCEDNGFALLKNSAGKVASLHASWSEWRGYQWRIEVYGTRGCVTASYPPMLARVVWAKEPGGPTHRKVHVFPKLQVLERLRSYRWTVLQSFLAELEAFEKATRHLPTPLALGADGWRSVQVAHAVYESSAKGTVLSLLNRP